ncbi:MAG: N-acetylmuramoyl-L-alanine amidase [Candidatus Hydrogenedentes bacterium]|nr:N-acetylmuramoyl-L-alanine amidase [Candidatus Hydrogenedentota bacterium]
MFTVPFDNGELRRIEAVETAIAGQPYVPLAGIVQELGGEWRVEAKQAEIKLFGATALLEAGTRRVFLQEQQYDLGATVEQLGDMLYLSVADVAPFFLQCFRIPLKHEAAPVPADPAEATNLLEEMAQPVAPAEEQPAFRLATVILDPGHGGSDAGIQIPGGAMEKEVALQIARQVARLLKEQSQLAVHLTRDADVPLSEQDRGRFCREHEGDLLVSIHCASSTSQKHHGVNVYYGVDIPAPAEGRPMFSRNLRTGQNTMRESGAAAQAIAQAAAQACSIPLQGVHALPMKLFAALDLPGVLVEVGYLSNPAEANVLATADYQQKLAQGIATGIVQAAKGQGGQP